MPLSVTVQYIFYRAEVLQSLSFDLFCPSGLAIESRCSPSSAAPETPALPRIEVAKMVPFLSGSVSTKRLSHL